MQTRGLIQELAARGLIAQTTDAEALEARLAEGPVTLYCGFDPTADSLHLGHLVPVLMLKRFQLAGHQPIALVGGATGMIGDPSFKAAERKLNTPDVVASWVEKIRGQLTPFLAFDGDNAAIMANNYDWFGSMNVLEFLRDIGKHFSVNAMIRKESVQQRLNRDDVGISFTEFSYSLLQGYDFSELNRLHGCQLQIGGSDQWGNITAGIDLTRRLTAQRVLAEQGTALVHGEAAGVAAQRIARSLFSEDIAGLTEDDLGQLAQDGMPRIDVARGTSLIDVLVSAGLAKSKSEARTFIESQAVAINGVKATSIDRHFEDADRLFGRYTLIRRGKKLYSLVVWQD